jgi:hypothetical protein
MSSNDAVRVTLRSRAKAPPPRSPLNMLSPMTSTLDLSSVLTTLLTTGADVLDAAAAAASGGARFLERIADERAGPTPARVTWTVRGTAGKKLQHAFVVTNDRASQLTGKVQSTDWYSDTKARPAVDIVRFEPSRVDLARGAAQPVRALITIPADCVAEEVLRATFFVEGSEQFRLPVEVHVTGRA